MKLFSWLQPKRRVLFLISLPNLPEFESCKKVVDEYTTQISAAGADVFDTIDEAHIKLMKKYDVTIVVAHHADDSDALVLKDGEMTIDDFVSYIPENYNGVLDFSSCNSVSAVSRIKEKCPDCRVQWSGGYTQLILRMYLYVNVIKYICDKKKADYHEVYMTALKKVKEKVEERKAGANSEEGNEFEDPALNTHLGSKGVVSVFSPKSVKQEVPFFVQVRCAKKKDVAQMGILAKKMDKSAREIESFDLPNMNAGDQFGASISIVGPYADFVKIEDPSSETITIGKAIGSIVFCLTVNKDFPHNEMTLKVVLEHNRQPLGYCYAKVKIKEESKVPAEIYFQGRDKEAEQLKAKNHLIDKLELVELKLEKSIALSSDDNDRKLYESKLELCRKCLEIIRNPRLNVKKEHNRVFVSSTSDLKDYRNTVKLAINDFNLSPEMYEEWPQKSMPPGDVCCQKVMESSALICILGSYYGSLEKSLDMSMTELEYRTAVLSGLPVLVYVVKPRQESKESSELYRRQSLFIKTIEGESVIKYFQDEEALFKATKLDLKSIKSQI